MRILQVTNIISHHQLPLARCLAASIGAGNFRFAITQPPNSQRQELGWKSDESDSWILRVGINKADRIEFERWWDEADVVLCGDRLFDRMKIRLNNRRLTFHMSERWWKPPIGLARLLHPRFALMTVRFRQLAKSSFFHFLAIGEYSAADIMRITNFQGKIWRWAYFTSIPDPLPAYNRKEQGFRVLWAGRMLRWKRVDTLIKSFSRLLVERPDATLTLVGEGPERRQLEHLAEKMLSRECYRFLPSMPATEVPKLMRQCHVYVLPSNAYEGWGAVVNEAMAEGCTVIASEATGAAKTMIRHGVNGLLFAPGDWRRLGDLLCQVSSDDTLRNRLADQGQCTIVELWSPKVAAKRFLSVTSALLAGQSIPVFDEGPMVITPKGRIE